MDNPICPSCNATKKTTCIYSKLNGLLKCDICGLYFKWPKPPLNKEFYTKDYYKAWSPDGLSFEKLTQMKLATSKRILNLISKYKNNGSLLEIGCAFGYFLKAAKEKGWDTYGIEVSGYAANIAKREIGVDKIITGNFIDASLPKNHFDLIVMIDVIEHIYDLKSILKKCKESLNQKGLLVIVTPDIDSFSRKCMGKHWPHFKKEHLVFFSRRNAKNILSRNDLKLLIKSNFKKALNFHYVKSIIHTYSGTFLIKLINIISILIPARIKKRNFFIPQGEILIIAQKK